MNFQIKAQLLLKNAFMNLRGGEERLGMRKIKKSGNYGEGKEKIHYICWLKQKSLTNDRV